MLGDSLIVCAGCDVEVSARERFDDRYPPYLRRDGSGPCGMGGTVATWVERDAWRVRAATFVAGVGPMTLPNGSKKPAPRYRSAS